MCPQILFFYIVTSHLPTIIETTRLLLTEASYLTSVAFELKLKKKNLLVIITDRVKQVYGKSEEWAANADVRLDPESIGKVRNPDDSSTHNKI